MKKEEIFHGRVIKMHFMKTLMSIKAFKVEISFNNKRKLYS